MLVLHFWNWIEMMNKYNIYQFKFYSKRETKKRSSSWYGLTKARGNEETRSNEWIRIDAA